ncbi:MAG: WbqC family protein [Bacteroidia bacterium]|nr:WbqC family protein [Bacteroidia bacterium]
MKKVLITQSNYIPWKGYFDSINMCDVFIVYDDMQFTKRDWRNRNQVKTETGVKWLTIPVEVKGKFFQKINETLIADKTWNKSHFDLIRQSYKKAACYKEVIEFIEQTYMMCNFDYLTEVNLHFINAINNFLGIVTPIKFSSEFILAEERTQRLVNICSEMGGTDYYSGPAAKAYMDESKFTDKQINVHYFDYSGYPEYTQLNGEFTHGVSILDLIFNTGSNAKTYMKSFKDEK